MVASRADRSRELDAYCQLSPHCVMDHKVADLLLAHVRYRLQHLSHKWREEVGWHQILVHMLGEQWITPVLPPRRLVWLKYGKMFHPHGLDHY